MPPTIKAPIKLSIREDHKADLVKAYFADVNDQWREEIATFSIGVMQKTPGLFDAWKELLTRALTHFLENKIGEKVVRVDEFRPHDTN